MTDTAFTEDALRVYALTIAYLHGEAIGNQGLTSAVQVQEISPAIFHLWHAEPPAELNKPMAPVAVCTHNQGAQTWRVELDSGEGLMLLDNQSVWDVVGEMKKKTKKKTKKTPVGKSTKKQRQLQKEAE